MTIYGAPRPPRSCLDRGGRSETTTADLDAMRAAAWHRHGVAALDVGFNPPGYDADPDTGVVVTHHRAVDTLGQMLANGTITQPMHDAGTLFRKLFRAAALGEMGASALAFSRDFT